VPGSVGSAAHTGLFIVGSHRAGAPWQRHGTRWSWHQDGHLHGDPVHILGWVGGIYLFVGLFSLVVIKQPAPGTAASPFWGAARHGSSRERGAGTGCWWLGRAEGTQPGMPTGTRRSEGGVGRARGMGHQLTAGHVALMAPPWQWLMGPLGDSSLGASKVSACCFPPSSWAPQQQEGEGGSP